MVGHKFGKSFTRAGLSNLIMRQHWPVLDDPPGENRVIGRAEGAYLLHYSDLGFESWLAKKDWRAASSGFQPQIKAEVSKIAESQNSRAQFLELYRKLHEFDDQQLQRLKDNGAHLYLELNQQELVTKHFGSVLV